MNSFSVILCIVNNGFSETVMDTARRFGAKGGTVLHGRGTASKEAEKIFDITIQPDKEIVMILIDSSIKNDMLNGLYDSVGMGTGAQGIAFALPVEDVVGMDNK